MIEVIEVVERADGPYLARVGIYEGKSDYSTTFE